MISLYDLAVSTNTDADMALRRVDTICKAWGETEVIISRGARPDKDTMISDRASAVVHRMARLGLYDQLPEQREAGK
ncbi:hypothetical protein ACFYP4_02235 [Streptomyces sp. NPDC005551]|uniref:hypothetical protein n=1 Tax=Streptomyces sp. NPDC005551 TaxID=3364725 RepID=UPI0036A84E51